MRKKHLFRFNLIEIILAMGVVAIGMTAVMALLPPALNANRDSAGDVIAAEIANKMITYIDMRARFVTYTNDAQWESAMGSHFTTGEKTFTTYTDDSSWNSAEGGTALPSPFQHFRDRGNGLLNYILQENGIDYCAANVLVWRENLPNPHNFGTGGTVRPGFRIFIRIGWPGEAPANAGYRQERTFIYDVLRPAQ